MFRLSKFIAILLIIFVLTLIHVSAAPVERPVNNAIEASDIEEASFNSLYDMHKSFYDQYYAQLASKSLVARSHVHGDYNECDNDDYCNGSDDGHDSCDGDHNSCDDNGHDDCHEDGSCDNGYYDHNKCGDDDSCDDRHDEHEESFENESISATSGASATVIYPPFPPLPPFPPFPPPATFPPFPPFPPSS